MSKSGFVTISYLTLKCYFSTANCVDPGTPENGAQSGSYGNGGVVTYTCDSAFSLVGASAITCSDGSWSNSVPICEGKATKYMYKEN